MGTRRSTGDDIEGCDSAIVWLEPMIVKWLNGLREENGLLSLESCGRRPSNQCRECIELVVGVVSACDGREAQDFLFVTWRYVTLLLGDFANCWYVLHTPKIKKFK